LKRIGLVVNSLPGYSETFLFNKINGLLTSGFHIVVLAQNRSKNITNWNVVFGHGLNSKSSLVRFIKVYLVLISTFFAAPVRVIRYYKLERNAGKSYLNTIKNIFNNAHILTQDLSCLQFAFGTLAINKENVAKVIGSKMIVSFRGYDLNYYKLDQSNIYQHVWQNADAFHFLGNDLLQRAIKRGYRSDKPNYLISPAIDIQLFKPEVNKKYLDQGVLNIVSVGRIVWKKGYEYGLKAIRILKDRNIPIQYTIVGGGDNLQAINFCIRELDIFNEVTITGSRSPAEIRLILSQNDIFLHPAISEGFCNAVLEAQAMKLPVVCTKADGLQENIEDGVTGFAVDIYDAIALADKIEHLYLNQGLFEQMGEAGRNRVENLFDIEQQINKFVKMYAEVI
jgi:colanic acid/amylovoran biosynthesis glycosyltransferase